METSVYREKRAVFGDLYRFMVSIGVYGDVQGCIRVYDDMI